MLSFQVIVGDEKCNGKCPFCVSKQTTTIEETKELCSLNVNWHNFRRAVMLAQAQGITSAVLTGKGEPTLYPSQITAYLDAFDFPLIDLQTNGSQIEKLAKSDILHQWHILGLTTVALSVCSLDTDENKAIMGISYDLSHIVKFLRNTGFMVRLSVVGVAGYIDTLERVQDCLDFCNAYDVRQFTWREVHAIERLRPRVEEVNKIKSYFKSAGTLLTTFPGGGVVYDFNGQNICLNQCLTSDQDNNDRNIIFFPNGDVFTRWEHPGSIILQGA